MEEASWRARVGMDVGALAIGAMAINASIAMGNPVQQPVGPGVIPTAVALALMLVGLMDLVDNWKSRPGRESGGSDGTVPEWLGLRKVWPLAAVGCAVMAAVLVWETVGGIVSILVCVLAVFAADARVSRIQAVVAALAIALFTLLVFQLGFGVKLLPW